MVIEIDYTIDEICDIIGGKFIQKNRFREIRFLALDSRKITVPGQTMFWAIDTKSREGSDFIHDLCVNEGVRCFITQDKIDLRNMDSATVVYVDNSLKALQKLAAHHRDRFPSIRVIGITGSNGKTIVKEWLAGILSHSMNTVKSPASYNSQIGAALSVLQIKKEHEVAIIEAGISRPHEMEHLAEMIKPDFGIITNIGSAHDEGFASRQQKIREKLKLFGKIESVVYPHRQTGIRECFEEIPTGKRMNIIGWDKAGTGTPCSYETERKLNGKSLVRLEWRESDPVEVDSINIPFTDQASIENAVTVYTALRAFGYYKPEMLPFFEELSPVRMRLEVKPGINGCSIIDDSYSNDVQSLEIAVDFLKQQNKPRKTLILSDFDESGISKSERYEKIADIVRRNKIDRFAGVGFDAEERAGSLDKLEGAFFFEDTDALLKWVNFFETGNEAILVKGARHFGFERVVHRLETHIHQTVLSVNLTNLAHNIRIYKSLLKPGTKIMAMVKAFAYGTGSMEISSLLEYIKADYLTVAYTGEGVDLRKAGIHMPVMVMNIVPDSFDTIIEYELEPEIYSFKILEDFSEFVANRKKKSYPVHLKFDTGMHRLGFQETDLAELIEVLNKDESLKIKSVFSHLSSSDNSLNDDFTLKQFETFMRIKDKIQVAFSRDILFHIANSGAISRFPEMHLDMVRLGIGMYGIDGNQLISKQLKTVNRLTTIISQIRPVSAGEVVGYNARRISKDSLIATVGIGYADGYPRVLGNGTGQMMTDGILVPTVGDVCMDMTMIDVSDVPGVKEGDEVIVFGEELPVQKMALGAGTIPYEIFTGISPRVRRIYYEES